MVFMISIAYLFQMFFVKANIEELVHTFSKRAISHSSLQNSDECVEQISQGLELVCSSGKPFIHQVSWKVNTLTFEKYCTSRHKIAALPPNFFS